MNLHLVDSVKVIQSYILTAYPFIVENKLLRPRKFLAHSSEDYDYWHYLWQWLCREHSFKDAVNISTSSAPINLIRMINIAYDSNI